MYQIRKGWPAQAAIDEVFVAATGSEIKEGMIVKLENGTATPASAVTGNIAFVMGQEPLRKTFVGLMSPCVIEFDKECCDDIASLEAGTALVAAGGKFAAGADASAIARVLKVNTDGTVRVYWFGSK